MNEYLQNHRGLVIFEGILFTLLGMLAVALPGISTLSTELFLGWLIFFSGVIQAYRTFKTRSSQGFYGSLITSILYIIFGVLLVLNPIAGVISITILLALFFILEGISKIYFAFELRHFHQWGWFIVSGLLSIAMAVIIWAGWPSSAFWVLGLLVGINLIFFGLSLLSLGWSHNSESKQV